MDIEDQYKLVEGFKGYVNKADITTLDPRYLVVGSKNVMVDYASRVVSVPGYTLYNQANTGGSGIKGSYEWTTSSGTEFSLRAYDGKLEFDWMGAYNLLKSGFTSSYFQFAKVWDLTEKIDVLLGVCGDKNMYKWSGAVATIRDATVTTIRKQGVLTSVSTISFVAGNLTSVAPQIIDSAGNFLNAGFKAGDTIYVSGSINNSRSFTVGSVTAGIITLSIKSIIVSEIAGPSVTLHNGYPTWASARFFAAQTGRAIMIGGNPYTYTGGESTDTLTGLSALPAIAQGAQTFQQMVTIANPVAIDTNFNNDFIAVQTNQVILASATSRNVYGSKTTDYTNFTLTSPRVPGDPFLVTTDNNVTCIVPIDNLTQKTSSIAFGAGSNEFFQLSFQLSQDNSNEIVRMIKLFTAAGSGLVSKDAITPIKSATAYISREPALDFLSNIQAVDTTKTIPISDPIKNDFDYYGTAGFANSHVKYFKRSIYILIPLYGVMLVYDMMRGIWQPPRTAPFSRLAVIKDNLYAHSATTNETYKLLTGTNDNGATINQVARFAYNNGGIRATQKDMSQYWSDGFCTPNALINMNVYFNWMGAAGKRSMTIQGNDKTVTTGQTGSPLGQNPLGENPLGGGGRTTLTTSNGLPSGMVRFWQEDTMDQIDHIESFIEYTLNVKDAQMAIVAHGSDLWNAGTVETSHRK